MPILPCNWLTFVRKVLSEPALPVKSTAVYRHKSLAIANFPRNYRFSSVLQFTYYPEQHKPELSRVSKEGFSQIEFHRKSLKIAEKYAMRDSHRKISRIWIFFFSSFGWLFICIQSCNMSPQPVWADSDVKKMSIFAPTLFSGVLKAFQAISAGQDSNAGKALSQIQLAWVCASEDASPLL